MAIGYTHTMFCDRRSCRAKVTIDGTRNAEHARREAHARHGWRCDETGDFCPADRAAPATTPPAIATHQKEGVQP